jgi:hypothetical protein
MESASQFIMSASSSQLDELADILKIRRIALNPFQTLPVDCFLVISSFLDIDSLATFSSICKYNNSLVSLDQAWSPAAKSRGIKKKVATWRESVKNYEERRRSWLNLEHIDAPFAVIEPPFGLGCCDLIGEMTLVCASRDRMVLKYERESEIERWKMVDGTEIESQMMLFKCIDKSRIVYINHLSFDVIELDLESKREQTIGHLFEAPLRIKMFGNYCVVIGATRLLIWDVGDRVLQSAFLKEFEYSDPSEVWTFLFNNYLASN